MNYFIVTGTSRGIGEAVAKLLVDGGNRVFCISRKKSRKLNLLEDENLEQISFDLGNVSGIDSLVDEIFSRIKPKKEDGFYLINNAGVLEPIGPIGSKKTEELIRNVNVNLVAPMILISAFIRNCQDILAEKRIINISSGAARTPFFGWGPYCSSKAGLTILTECVGLEQADSIKIVSFAPGIVDTEMQGAIRKAKKEDFANLDSFIAYKDKGMLLAPDFVARKILDLVFLPNIKQGRLYRIEEF